MNLYDAAREMDRLKAENAELRRLLTLLYGRWLNAVRKAAGCGDNLIEGPTGLSVDEDNAILAAMEEPRR